MNKFETHSLDVGAPTPSGLTGNCVGQRVQIRSGILQGVQGMVLERNALGRVLLSVDCIGDGVYVQVTDNLLEPTP